MGSNFLGKDEMTRGEEDEEEERKEKERERERESRQSHINLIRRHCNLTVGRAEL